MTGDRHNPNMELIGQGLANLISPLFGGIPALGRLPARPPTFVPAHERRLPE